MKRILALLLAAVMCLSLVACGGNAESNDSSTEQIQGSSNNEQSQESSTNEQQQENTNTESDTNTANEPIEITLENWQEYYEWENAIWVSRSTNSFGEQKEIAVRLITGYVPTFDTNAYTGENSFAMEYSTDYVSKDFIFNTETGEVEIVDCTCGNEHQATPEDSQEGNEATPGSEAVSYDFDIIEDGKVIDQRIHIPFSFQIPYQFVVPNSWIDIMTVEQDGEYTGHITYYPVNVTITRIQGTLEPKN